MHRISSIALAAALAIVPVLPAAGSTPVRLTPCTGGTPLTLSGSTFTADMPLVAGDVATAYKLDLSGQVVGPTEDMDDTARVSATSTWLVAANDYDLAAAGEISENYQPLDPAEEFVQTGQLKHCSTVSIDVVNFLATGGDSVDVTVSVSLK